jgi:hypothetical protein
MPRFVTHFIQIPQMQNAVTCFAQAVMRICVGAAAIIFAVSY